MECVKNVIAESMQTAQEALLATNALLDLFQKMLERTVVQFAKQGHLNKIESVVCRALLEVYPLWKVGQNVCLVGLAHTKQETPHFVIIAQRESTMDKIRLQKNYFAGLARHYPKLLTTPPRLFWIACVTRDIL